ncbi:MAG: hypothetical protein K2O91_24980 [Lachnospiraceae bacterium]|nr:hypothetical protein [Lachnospiraceae bacterium]
MAQNITEAIEEVSLIKRVIDRTQNDFSRIANFFIAIGVVNLATYLLYAIILQIIKGIEQVPYSVWRLFWGLNYVSITGYVILFWLYRYKMKKWNNHLSMSLINIWGVLLIGGEVFRLFFSSTYFQEQNVHFYQKTLMFLFPVIGCFVLGFVIQDKLILWVSFVVAILYMFLAVTGFSVSAADFHGNDMEIGLDAFLTAAVVSVGMVLLGMELKRKGAK